MGLASSQARMLLLTARKSDLEYRAQAISQRKMNIAMQTQQLATEYSTAMSNRKLSLIVASDASSGKVYKEDLSYAGLMSECGTAVGDFLVMTSEGEYLITGDDSVVINENGWTEKDENLYRVGKKLAAQEGIDSTIENINNLVQELSNAGKLKYIKDANDNTCFQYGLRNGSYHLLQAKNVQMQTETDENGKEISYQTKEYECVPWSALSVIADDFNTSDDSAAQAEYESKSLILANQDKMLDLELQQIETQHKAIETEYDSVKKVIENNIKVSFKIFS